MRYEPEYYWSIGGQPVSAGRPKHELMITRYGWRRLCVARLQYGQRVDWALCIWRPLLWVTTRKD